MADNDQSLLPAGRLFVQPNMEQVINCAISGDHPFHVAAVRSDIENSIMVKHPRFTSRMVRDSRTGREYWRKTKVDLDRHIIIIDKPIAPSDDEYAVNSYLADLSVSSLLPTDKPLWEVHMLMAHNTIVCRFHHALGDGVSLMSMMLSLCRRVDDPEAHLTLGGVMATPRRRGRRRWMVWRLLKVVWYTLFYVLELALRGLWKRDKTTALSGGDGVELWPRRLATARFRLEDMKIVKGAVVDATINDVLFGIISSGFSRYFDIRSAEALPEGLPLTGVAMVNLRPQPGLQDLSKLMSCKTGTQWSNKFGMILLPVYYHRAGSDPIQFVKRAKAMMDKKKLSLEAPCSYKVRDLIMSLFGPKLVAWLNYRICCNTTFTISNVIGPQEKITLTGNPVRYIRVSSSSLPHGITMHMVSYAGMADMQILAAKEIIPDPKFLAKCFEDALVEMKEAARATIKS